MRSIIQRVKSAQVAVSGEIVGKIDEGLLVLLGVCDEDTEKDLKWLADKIAGLRIFTDSDDKMNLSLEDIDGEILIVSQFTLYGKCKKGRRPDFTSAGKPQYAEKMYEDFVEYMRTKIRKVETGIFGEHMEVSLLNDGPVTLFIDSKE